MTPGMYNATAATTPQWQARTRSAANIDAKFEAELIAAEEEREALERMRQEHRQESRQAFRRPVRKEQVVARPRDRMPPREAQVAARQRAGSRR